VFQLEGERSFVHQEPIIVDKWSEYVLSLSKNQKHKAQCLITGEIGDIPALHPPIVGVFNAHTAGAGIVAINKDKTAFCSYNKTQGYNSPISELAAFKYTTTLNRLLQNNSMQKIQIGDATTVFWTERESPIEGMFGMMLDPKDLDTPDKAELLHVLEAIKEGKKPQEIDPNVKFYILGLSPNGPRLSIRFWHVCEVGQVEENIGKHFKDLNIQRCYESDPQYPGVRKLLYETINKKSRDKEPSPLLAGAMMRSILEGANYPESLLSSILNRIRADRNINYIRVAMLKAILSRKYRKQEMEVSVMLNKENKNCAYLLGRLFAVLERVQKEAIPGANTTIKDRFYGSASATPRVVFPQLLRLTQHHIQKAKYGHLRDKEIEEIISDIQEFPSHLKLDEQGVFAIGYYHQRNNKEN
jgi:CRISPR-associated protein Csd1